MEVSRPPSFGTLANTWGSDKGDKWGCAHNYAPAYERLLRPLAERGGAALLEIGLLVAGNAHGALQHYRATHGGRLADGAVSALVAPSLRCWQEYLRPALLVGADINSHCAHAHDPARGVHVVIGDATTAPVCAALAALAAPRGGYDVVIDDASHASAHQQATLGHLWGAVAPGGLYIIEDLHYQPWPEPHGVPRSGAMLDAWARGDDGGAPTLYAAVAPDLECIERYDSASRNPQWPRAALRGALAVLRKRARPPGPSQ